MDAAQLGEWSRLLVSGSVVAFAVAWLAFSADLVRTRAERVAKAAVTEPITTAVPAGAGGEPRGIAERPPSDAERSGDDALTTPDADRMARIGLSVTILATVLLALGVVTRTLAVGRAPWGNMYEFAITGSVVAAGVFLGVSRTKTGRAVASWLVLLLLLTLGLAVTVLYVPPGPLVPALQSFWLVLHVGLAVVAFALFTVAAVVSGLQIASERAQRRGKVTALPAAGTLDRLAYRLIAVAFPIWTVGPLILGAIWAEVSWGRYWGWDPKEVWALISWLVYAAYLHARATAGWKGMKASVVSLIGYATVLFSYFAVNIVFNGLHSYGGVG